MHTCIEQVLLLEVE